jgi:putative hydrolase
MKYCFDVHTHTIASGHAYSTFQELVTAATQKGLKLLGISDHAPCMPGSAYIYYFQNLRVVPKEINGLMIMTGVEASIIDFNGKIDMSPEDLKHLDYTIASFHPPCIRASTKKNNTKALIKTMENPFVNIIGHPDDVRYEMDYEAIVLVAKENNVLLEVNNASLSPKGFRKDSAIATRQILELSMRYDHPIILGSDAHISYDVGNFSYCEPLLQEIGFPEELIANTSVEKLKAFLKNKRSSI